jgi:hypothetical protein
MLVAIVESIETPSASAGSAPNHIRMGHRRTHAYLAGVTASSARQELPGSAQVIPRYCVELQNVDVSAVASALQCPPARLSEFHSSEQRHASEMEGIAMKINPHAAQVAQSTSPKQPPAQAARDLIKTQPDLAD